MKKLITKALWGTIIKSIDEGSELAKKFFPRIILKTKTIVDKSGKTRIQLASHTKTNPREIVIEPYNLVSPKDANKHYVHIRTWDGEHVPANMSQEEKLLLMQTFLELFPEGHTIAIPASNMGYLATRGTIRGLKLLEKSPLFLLGKEGPILYTDKNGNVKTYMGHEFTKIPSNSNEDLSQKSADDLEEYLLLHPELIIELTEWRDCTKGDNFYSNQLVADSLGRFQRNLEKELPNFLWDKELDGATYDLRIDAMVHDLLSAPVYKYNIPFNYVYGEPEGFMSVHHFPLGAIWLNKNAVSPELFDHESNHILRQNIDRYFYGDHPNIKSNLGGWQGGRYYPKEAKMLDDAYNFPQEVVDYIGEGDILSEKGAMNLELRKAISEKHGKVLDLDLDLAIDSTSLQEIKLMLKNLHSLYSWKLADLISEKDIPNIKKALKYVGMTTIPIGIGYGVSLNKQGGKLKLIKRDKR